MPAGKITAHVSGTSALIQRIRLPARLDVEVVGGDSRAGAPLTPEMFKDAAAAAAAGQKDANWQQELSVPLEPSVTSGMLRVSVVDADGTPVAVGERSLGTVLVEDVDRAHLELQDPEGMPAGTIELVLRFFHGRSPRAQRALQRTWSGMHRDVRSDQAQFVY